MKEKMNEKMNRTTPLTRRAFLKTSVAAGAVYWLGPRLMIGGKAYAAPVLTPLDPTTIPKYATPLVNPPAMPRTSVTSEGIDYYEIAIRQFQQQILPTGNPKTTVWSYGSVNHSGTFNYPAFTIEARVNVPVRVKWINQLCDANGNYYQHLLPVDPTLHWANPPGPIDTRPTFATTPGRYAGPVPMVTHLHGGHTGFDSDGYAEAWYLPNAVNIPVGYSRKGSKYASPYGATGNYQQGFAVFQYPNDQRAATCWYHDHTLGMTRLNVYAGPAGFYLIRGGADDLTSGLPVAPYEIPIAIQDRSFYDNGSLFYPDSRAFFDEYAGPYIPTTPVSPIWNPEFFGDTIVVNGNTWPKLSVQKRRYRFRFLNGTQARTLILKMVTNATARPGVSVLPFWLIGTEGGFLPAPVQLNQLIMGNAERNDVIVDFTNVPAGTVIYLINEGPDGPFNGEIPPLDPPIADPMTTGQVMKFTVVAVTGTDTSTPPQSLALPAFVGLGAAATTRQVSLIEEAFDVGDDQIPVEVLLGTPSAGKLMWADAISEKPPLGATEVWEVYNTTVDAHPIHIHEVLFQVVNRQEFDADQDMETGALTNISLVGQPRLPGPQEAGFKDTVLALPGEVTRVKARFDLPNLYVWHCHIVEHEDNEMMRPYFVTQNPSVNLGAALGYPLLGLTGVKISMSDKKSGILGNVGLGPNGEQNFSDGFITGTFFVDPTAKNKTSKNVVITGGTAARGLSQAVTDALAASAQAARLLPAQIFGKIDKSLTIPGNTGLKVIQVSSIELKGETLTLSGGPGSEFIINVLGKLKLDGGSKIQLAGGILPSQVLINVINKDGDVTLSGAAQASGTFLAPQRKVALSGASLITGAVVAGGDIALSGGSMIKLVS